MRKETRSVLLELAIIVPVLAAIVFGGTDLILASMVRTNVNSLAQTLAACTVTPGCNVATETKNNTTPLGFNPEFLTVQVEGKVVTVSYVYHLLGPLSATPQFKVSATSS